MCLAPGKNSFPITVGRDKARGTGYDSNLWDAITVQIPGVGTEVHIPASPALVSLPYSLELACEMQDGGAYTLLKGVDTAAWKFKADVMIRFNTFKATLVPGTRIIIDHKLHATEPLRWNQIKSTAFSSAVLSQDIERLCYEIIKDEACDLFTTEDDVMDEYWISDNLKMRLVITDFNFSRGHQYTLLCLDKDGNPYPLTYRMRTGGIELDLFCAASKILDIYTFYLLYNSAWNGAFAFGREVEFIDAVHLFISYLKEIKYFHDVAVAYNRLGEIYESLATKRDQQSIYLPKAAEDYYAGIQICLQHPNDVAFGQLSRAYADFGLCLKRLGLFDAAEAAYRWSMFDPGNRPEYARNFGALMHFRSNPTHDTESLKIQKSKLKENVEKFRCDNCGGTVSKKLVCSRCKDAVYCDRQCQVAHYKAHKSRCKEAR